MIYENQQKNIYVCGPSSLGATIVVYIFSIISEGTAGVPPFLYAI